MKTRKFNSGFFYALENEKKIYLSRSNIIGRRLIVIGR